MKIERNSYIDALDSIQVEISQLSRQLDGVVHPNIIKKLEGMRKRCLKEIAPILKAEEKANDSNYDKLSKIQDKYNLKAVWSMSIPATELENLTPHISKITYDSWGPQQVHTFDTPTQMSWLELWKLADKMIAASGDTHHIFIENLYHNEKDPEGHFHLSTGS
jgi:hypothetical protein